MQRVLRGIAAAVVGAALLMPSANAGHLAIPRLYKKCDNFNAKYPHGVGRIKAVDKTTGDPVTNFKRSTRLYNLAVSFNRGLDRDRDGIACEKA